MLNKQIPAVLLKKITPMLQQLEASIAEDHVSLRHDKIFQQSYQGVIACSDYIAKQCLTRLDLVQDLFASGDIAAVYHPTDHKKRLLAFVGEVTSREALYPILRRFRQREMIRIAWRDLCGWASLTETLTDLSMLADTILQVTLDKLFAYHGDVLGIPVDDNHQRQQLMIIAVGKLGGRELNFSSDIDLIFCFPHQGQTQGGARILSNQQFFTIVAQDLVKILTELTDDGFVYRVDLRLRPYGQSGPVVISFNALEAYYQEQGRGWERFALVKARMITGSQAQKMRLQQILLSFVYRRYIDYGVIDSLREMKRLIDHETRRMSLQHNIKRGPGGIRELEFIIQAYQIIRGGKEPYLQEQCLLTVLPKLVQSKGLSQHDAKQLTAAYDFLRRLENRIQMIDDRQTHDLPTDEIRCWRIVYAMHYEDWQSFFVDLQKYRRIVEAVFKEIVEVQEKPLVNQKAQRVAEDILALWRGRLVGQEAVCLLTSLGLQTQQTIFTEKLVHHHHSVSVRKLSSTANQRLARLIVPLVICIAKQARPIEVLTRIIDILDKIVNRSAYVALLTEHPKAMTHLVELCHASSWLAKYVAQHPILLDELLDLRLQSATFERQALQARLQQILLSLPEGDIEAQGDALREFKLESILRLVAADIASHIDIVTVGLGLTHIATIILEQVLALAWQQMKETNGVLVSPQGLVDSPDFAIIGYGKLGSQELSYQSDLDLVFLYQGDDSWVSNGPKPLYTNEYYSRLARRLVNLLGIRTFTGVLYAIDTQLRPSGHAGLLVSSVQSFASYQQDKAWTWEHQALVRARVVTGSAAISQSFNHIRQTILCRQRESNCLKNDIKEMRERIRTSKNNTNTSIFDLKYGTFGIIDIEFMVQYLVLLWSKKYPVLVENTDTLSLLQSLGRLNLLSKADVAALSQAYRVYRQLANECALQDKPPQVADERVKLLRQRIHKIWQAVLP